MKWLKVLLFTALISGSSGCASLNPLDILNPSKGVEVSANVGKNVEQEKNNIKLEQGTTTTKQEAETISNDTSYKSDVVNQITNELTWWQWLLILACVGAALPSWREMGVGVKVAVSEGYKGLRFIAIDICNLLVVPVRGFGDWILKALGRT